MRKKKVCFAVSTSLILTLFSSVMLASCNHSSSQTIQTNSSSQSSETLKYKVTYNSNNEYSVTGLKEEY